MPSDEEPAPATSTPSEMAPGAQTGEWALVWNDEFDAPGIDLAKWSRVVVGGGFGNNELQYYTDAPDNSFIEHGCLVIKALRRAYKGQFYTSAKVVTQGQGDWTYGRFEVRARMPSGQGLWPAIWMLPSDPGQYGPWPACGEIDIAELVGHRPGTVHGTLHYGNPRKKTGGSFSLPAGGSFADDFHVFALEWVPGQMTWFVDGRPYSVQTNWHTSASRAMWPAPFDQDFYLQLNVAVGGNWPGQPDEATVFPQRMLVDYVRVYQYTGVFPPVEKRSAGPMGVQPREPLPDGNLVYNGTFDTGTEYWELTTSEGAEASWSEEDGMAVVFIRAAGDFAGSVRLTQAPFQVVRGRTYEVAFNASAAQPREISVRVGRSDRPWDSYSGDHRIAIGPVEERHSLHFRMDCDTDPAARLEFRLGDSVRPVTLDHVTVRMTDGDAAYETGPAARSEDK